MPIEFTTLLGLELDMIEKIIEPQDEMQPGDEILGEISGDLRKLYTVWKQMGKSAGALENDIQWGNTSLNAFGTVQELKAKASIVKAILWIAIQDELHLWDCKVPLALRTGWKVVSCKSQGFPIFRMFGGPE